MKSVMVIGLGRFGQTIVRKLSELNHQVLAIDRNESRVNEILPLATNAQIGDATSETFLDTLGVNNFDVCFVAIGDDFQSSLEITYLLKELGARKVVSRASREVHRKILLRNGADEVVYPEGQMAEWTAVRNTTDYVLDYISLDADHFIFEVTVPAEWNDKTVGALGIRQKYDLNILAIREQGLPSRVVNSDTLLKEGQTILVLGKWKDIQKCFRV